MKAIKDFLNNLGEGHFKDVVKDRNSSNDNMVYLLIHRVDYIVKVLIPFFDAMIWQTKKEKDYQDWKSTINLKNLGLQYTEEGSKLIDLIISQMNNNRLSTSGLPRVDRAHLQIEIDKLLSGPSNLEEKEDGRIFIKSLNRYLSTSAEIRVELQDENGNAIKIFDSAADCANSHFFFLAQKWALKRFRPSSNDYY